MVYQSLYNYFILILLNIIPSIFKVTAETNMLEFFPDNHYVTTSSELVEKKLTGVMPLEVNFYSTERDGFKKSANCWQTDNTH
jgi:hypothetical protein